MKGSPLLNRHLSRLVSSLGHLDQIVVADAGLPVPSGVEVIDLAVSPSVPSFWEVAMALQSELTIEQAVFADEVAEELRTQMSEFVKDWGHRYQNKVGIKSVPHETFKNLTGNAKAIIRTGEFTPHCNMILVSGVPF